MAIVELEHSEYWMPSVIVHDPDMSPEFCGITHEIPDAMLAAERAAFEAWRLTVRAIYDYAGRTCR